MLSEHVGSVLSSAKWLSARRRRIPAFLCFGFQSKTGLAHSLTSVSVEIHKYPRLCGPFKECTRHIPDDSILYSDREMMNSSNSPAPVCLKLPSNLPNWAKGPLLSEMLGDSRKAPLMPGSTALFFPFIQLPGNRQRGKGRKAFMICFTSPAQEND